MRFGRKSGVVFGAKCFVSAKYGFAVGFGCLLVRRCWQHRVRKQNIMVTIILLQRSLFYAYLEPYADEKMVLVTQKPPYEEFFERILVGWLESWMCLLYNTRVYIYITRVYTIRNYIIRSHHSLCSCLSLRGNRVATLPQVVWQTSWP